MMMEHLVGLKYIMNIEKTTKDKLIPTYSKRYYIWIMVHKSLSSWLLPRRSFWSSYVGSSDYSWLLSSPDFSECK